MADDDRNDTHQKALRVNLDPSVFGSFSEIGAAQEVARWFLRVGAASGTVAKTISAYDKDVSDAIYGAGTRYVSRPRLEAMLESEWGQLRAQVSPERARTTRLFAFADTVATRNYQGTNDAHGWMGLRFQPRPEDPPGDILLHINLRDLSAVQQQEALGVLGVNLIHAVHYETDALDRFLAALVGQLEEGRVEIDLIDIAGPHLAPWRTSIPARLLLRGMAEAVAFDARGAALPPSELVYKSPVVLAPGAFEHPAPVHAEILRAGVKALAAELAATAPAQGDKPPPKIVGAFCLTASGAADDDPAPSADDIAARVETLIAAGSPTLASRRRQFYHVTALINRSTSEPVRFAVGVSALLHIFAEAHYRSLEGRILEGVARLFASNVRFYVCPMPAASMRAQLDELAKSGWSVTAPHDLVGADHVRPPAPLGHLYDYLLESGFVAPMRAAGA